jgi:hypothetical protein
LELGAEPVGVDIGNLEGEEFEHYQLNLLRKKTLDFLPDHSFDAINMSLLLSSPQLEKISTMKQREEMEVELKHQVERLLKDDGKIIEMDV